MKIFGAPSHPALPGYESQPTVDIYPQTQLKLFMTPYIHTSELVMRLDFEIGSKCVGVLGTGSG